MTYVTPDRALNAIRTITDETGFPPSPEELAEVFGVSVQSLHSSLLPLKRSGEITYDADGNFTTRAAQAALSSGPGSGAGGAGGGGDTPQ